MCCNVSKDVISYCFLNINTYLIPFFLCIVLKVVFLVLLLLLNCATLELHSVSEMFHINKVNSFIHILTLCQLRNIVVILLKTWIMLVKNKKKLVLSSGCLSCRDGGEPSSYSKLPSTPDSFFLILFVSLCICHFVWICFHFSLLRSFTSSKT